MEFTEGSHTLYVWANDSVGNLASTSVGFTIDTITPTIQIQNLINSTYKVDTLLVNFSYSDNREVDTVWYNWNGTNVTFSSALNVTFAEGLNTLHVWVNDSAGNLNSTSVTFTIDALFSSVWHTDATSFGSSASNSIKLPLVSTGTYDFLIDWGDESSDHIINYNQAECTHTYDDEGIYTVSIKGIIQGWAFSNGGDRLKLYSITNWGSLRLGNDGDYFRGCTNLKITATDLLDLTGTTILRYAFSSSGIETGS